MTTTNLLTSTLPKWFPVSPANRRLDYDNDDNYQSYLVDSDGNSYEPYAMAWRYLGMYIDCDVQQEYSNDGDYDGSDVYRNRQRQRRTTTAAPIFLLILFSLSMHFSFVSWSCSC